MTTHSARRITFNERAKLTAAYSALVMLLCVAFVSMSYALLQAALPATVREAATTVILDGHPTPGVDYSAPYPNSPHPQGADQAIGENYPATVTRAVLDRYLTIAAAVFIVLSAVSVLVAWWFAGRVLRPVAAIADKARAISAWIHRWGGVLS